MREMIETYFNKIYWSVCALIFVVIALRAFFIPFSHDEAATFFFYIQSDNYLPYKAHVYTNNHVLNSALANVCFHLAGSHRFVLRLPNVFSFLILCVGTFRFFKHLNRVSSKVILVCFFILSINFLDFFELCRGYGISAGVMVLGLSYLQDYFKDKALKHFLFFSICWQLALAANLILVVVLAVLLFYVFIFQIKNKLLLKPNNLWIQVFNLLFLFFWIKFSFFYKAHNVLDAGAGDDYWQVTFKSLIVWIYGTENVWIQILAVFLFCLMVFYATLYFFKSYEGLNSIFIARFFYPFVLFTLILVFYLQKKLLDVNFPEDRTGLFFYLFFALAIAFIFDNFPKTISALPSILFLFASVVYFIFSLNFSNFSSPFYYTMPKSFYDKLKSEYDKLGKIYTIGGHRVRELNFAFLNYRGGSMLNPMDDGEQMRMNCDYYYASKYEEPYYRFFYDEIAYEAKWNHVLLKRKTPIARKILATAGSQAFKGNSEFFEFLRITDTSFSSKNCLEAELGIRFNQMPKPFNAFLVFSVNNLKNETVYYKRIALNMLADNLSGETKYFKLVTGQMPPDFKEAVVYIWNIDKKNCDFNLISLQINELYGKGINFVIPQKFYPLIENITRKPIL